jgi:type I restriction-modification system DNA methylase subunit
MKQTSSAKDIHKLISTAGLLIIDALVLSEIIAARNKEVPTLSILLRSANLKKEIENSWQYIIKKINYQPVLQIALDVLRNMSASPTLDKQLRNLVELAYDMASSRVLLRHDLFGRIYHRLLLGELVKYYATYYTSIPAARLLARLLVNLPSTLDAKDVPPKYGGEPLRVVDFACGSGTLLSAVYKELDTLHRISSERLRIDELHKYLIEEGLWGFDVLHHAVHLAATVLFLHNPIPVDKSKLYALRLGDGDGRYLGSINFLTSPKLSGDMVLAGQIAGGIEEVSVSKREAASIELPLFHICIMNPPFTRSVGGNLLFGSLPKKERAALRKRLSEILNEKGLAGIGQAGLGAVFVFLADEYLVEGGRIGLVLPRAVLSGVAWEKVREKLLSSYHIEYIITSYEINNQWNFSENTDLSEILLVARKRRAEEEAGFTIFANLWRKPKNELESIHLGSQLKQLHQSAALYNIENSNVSQHSLKLQGAKIGEAYSARLEDLNFGVYNFFSQMELNRTSILLRKGIVYTPDQGIVGHVKLTTLSNLGAEIGPDRRQVHSVFRLGDKTSQTMYKALWGYDSNTMNTISQRPNAYLEPVNAGQARELWSKRGKLLIVERARLNTFPVLAVYSDEPVLSNVWWPIKLDNDVGKFLAIWINSTFGFLLLSSIAEVTQGPWVDFKKRYLADLPVLDVNKLKRHQKEAFLQLYDKLVYGRKICELRFKALPEEFAQPDARKIIDEEICNILGLKLNLGTLYRMLSTEPMLTG